MAEQIISASGTQYGLIINADGSVPISGTIAVTTGSVSYQGTSPWVVAGSVAITNADIQVAINVNDYISVTPSGTFYTSVSASGTGGIPISGVYFPGSVSQATTPWIVLGSQQITNDILQISGNTTISNDSYITVKPSGTTGFPISGTTTISGTIVSVTRAYIPSGNTFIVSGNVWSGVGSITGSVLQGTTPWVVLGSQQITNQVLQVSGNVTISNDNYVKITPSGTFYTTIIASGTTGIPISGNIGVIFDSDYVNVVQSGTNWTVLGSTQITNSVLQISGPVKLTDDSFIKIIPSGTFYSSVFASGTTGLPISGAITVNNIATAGSLDTQKVTPSGIFYTTIIGSGTTGLPISGVVTITNLATAGSLATQGIIGSVQVTNSTIQVSGNVTISNDNYVYVRPSGTFYTTGSFNIASIGSVWNTNTYYPGSVWQVTTPWQTSGTANVLGSVAISSSATLQISGPVKITNDSYINVIASGTTGMPVSGVFSVTTGSENYIYGKSGANWYPLIVDSGAGGGTLRTSATVTVDRVYIASGADIGSVYIKDGAYINIIPSGTFYTTGSFNLVNGGYVTGSVAITSSATLNISGPVKTTDDSYMRVIASGTLGFPISGVITVSNLATAGSLATQTITPSGTFYATIASSGTTGLPISGTVTVSGTLVSVTRAYVPSGNIFQPSGNTFIVSGNAWAGIGSITGSILQGTSPWIILGSSQITNTTLQISGPIKITDDSFLNVIPSGTFYSSIEASGTTGLPISGGVTVSGTIVSVTRAYIPSGNIYMPSGLITRAFVPSGNIFVVSGNVWSGVGSITGSVLQGTNPWIILGSTAISTDPIPISGVVTLKKLYTFITGSVPTSAGAGSKVVSMYGECGLVSLAGSNVNAGSTYKFGIDDTDGYMVLSMLTRAGSMSYLTPFPVSGNTILRISDAQSNSNYNFKVAYI